MTTVAQATAAVAGNPTTPERVFILTAMDRCDHCGARAYHMVTMAETYSKLMFCHHHGQLHREKLEPLSVEWLDESAAINPPKAFYN